MPANPNLLRPELDGASFSLDSGPVSVLLFHGFTATTAEVRLLANGLHDCGYTVSAPLLPGHGVTPQELNRVRWKDWMDTAEKSYTDLASRSACVIVGGESMGALLALWLASLHPEIRGVLLFAPALRVPALRWVEWVSPFMQEVQKKNIDEEMAWQGYPVYPLKGAVQLLRLQRSVAKRLGSVCQPLRIFQGRLDQTIDPGCGETILKGVRSRDKEIIWMENSGHCILLDRELETVLASSIQFIQMVSR